MFEVQSYGEKLGAWVTLARKESIEDAIDSAQWIAKPWPGESRKSEQQQLRIVDTTRTGKTLAIYDAQGAPVTRTRPTTRKRQLVTA